MSSKLTAGWIGTHKILSALIVLVLFAGSATGSFFLISSAFGTPSPESQSPAVEESDQGNGEEAQEQQGEFDQVSSNIVVMPQPTTPFVARLKGLGNGTNSIIGVEKYQELTLSQSVDGQIVGRASGISVQADEYQVDFIGCINADGSIYEEPEVQSIDAKAGGTVDITVKLKLIPADQVTEEQLQKLASRWEQVVEKGGGALSGEVGQRALDQVRRRLEEKRAGTDGMSTDEAITKAKNEGKMVFTGTLRVFKTDTEVADFQGVKMPYDSTGAKYGPYTVLKLDQPLELSLYKEGLPDPVTHEASMICLTGNGMLTEEAEKYSAYDGQRVVIAIDANKLQWPTGVRMPNAQPFVTEAVEILWPLT